MVIPPPPPMWCERLRATIIPFQFSLGFLYLATSNSKVRVSSDISTNLRSFGHKKYKFTKYSFKTGDAARLLETPTLCLSLDLQKNSSLVWECTTGQTRRTEVTAAPRKTNS